MISMSGPPESGSTPMKNAMRIGTTQLFMCARRKRRMSKVDCIVASPASSGAGVYLPYGMHLLIHERNRMNRCWHSRSLRVRSVPMRPPQRRHAADRLARLRRWRSCHTRPAGLQDERRESAHLVVIINDEIVEMT